MATVEAPAQPHDRQSRRRPFSNLMKRLANLKNNASSDSSANGSNKRNNTALPLKVRKTIATNGKSPYPAPKKTTSSKPSSGNGHLSFHTPPSGVSISDNSATHSRLSVPASSDGHAPPTISGKSAAPTVATNADTVHSEAAQSRPETVATAGATLSSTGISGGEGSTFSSPTPSVCSLTTTLTTIQSAAPSALLPNTNTNTQTPHSPHPRTHSNHHHHHHQHLSSQFTHQFPSSPQPASAIPSHVIPQTGGGHPATYNTATANNLLTDNASVLTLASSSKRRRRNSLDTNASVRALAPSSIFGGSRESLPLSLLSSNVEASSAGLHQGRPSVGGSALPNTERASVYSSSGNAPALSSERNSYYAGKQPTAGDAASVRSGLAGHGRNDSITGSIGAMAATGSPLASPREAIGPQGRISRRNSGWGEVGEEDSDEEKEGELAGESETKGGQGV